MKKITLILTTVFLAHFLAAQSYNTSIGMRLGTDWGLSLQQRIAKKMTLEAIMQKSLFRNDGNVTFLVEQHLPLISKRFNFYVGGGIHNQWGKVDGERYSAPGVTLVSGVEFSIGRLNLSYDFMPGFNFNKNAQPVYLQSGLTVRHILVKKRSKKQRERQKRRKKRKKDRKKDGFDWRFWEKES